MRRLYPFLTLLISFFGFSLSAQTIQDSCRANFEVSSLSSTSLGKTFTAITGHSNNKRPEQVCWSFGDGKDTCINYNAAEPHNYSVTHFYTQPGLYNVCVKIKYQGGCEASKCKPIAVGQQDSCSADFERISTLATNALTVSFRALPSHSNQKKPSRICWTFGDSKDTCIEYPENYSGQYTVAHAYSTTGNYEVCVKILYNGGCEARKCKLIHAGLVDSCKSDFERIPTGTNNTLTASFRALPWHSNQKNPSRICWKFGDTKDTCIEYPENYTGQYTVTHTYANPGNYEVCATIKYQGGCEARKCKVIHAGLVDSCKSDFERIPTTSAATTSFRALPWHNREKKPSKICWTFGDGKDTCIQYPENYNGQYTVGHNYTSYDSFEVCVKILYYGGCEAQKCKRTILTPPYDSCTVRLFEITPAANSLTRGFYITPSSSSGRRPERICWYFGDGKDTCIMLTASNAISQYFIYHTYPAPGIYRPCVKVLFAGGCIAADCKEVAIRNYTSICGGYMLDSLVNPFTFKFRGQGIQNTNDAVVEYRWSFGDGSGGTGQEVRHTYALAGTYEVCLGIKTVKGCETRVCKKLLVPGGNQSILQLSPNPVVNELHVVFFSNRNETISIKIFNSNGTMVRNYSRTALVGANTWNFDVSGLTPGIYSVIVQSPNQMASGMFFKQ